jgi:hypothetical protein
MSLDGTVVANLHAIGSATLNRRDCTHAETLSGENKVLVTELK